MLAGVLVVVMDDDGRQRCIDVIGGAPPEWPTPIVTRAEACLERESRCLLLIHPSSVNALLSSLDCGRSRSWRSLGISGFSESCLRRWIDLADVDDGRKPALMTDERPDGCVKSDWTHPPGVGEAAPREAGARVGDRDPQAGVGVLRSGEHPPK